MQEKTPTVGMAEPYDQLGEELIRLTRCCRGIDKQASARAGLTVDEMHCISVLRSERPSSVKRLSELITVGPTRASKILRDLERKGLVSRSLDAADRRREQVVLTHEGMQIAERVLSLYREIGDRFLREWPGRLPSDFSWLLSVISRPG